MPDDTLLEQYDFGETGDGLYEGSVAVPNRPSAKRPEGIPAVKAVPPKDPTTGKFLPAQTQASAPNARKQEPTEDPIDEETPEKHEHSRSLFRRAVQSGFTDQEIDASSSDELEEKIYARLREAVARKDQSPQPVISARDPVTQKPTTPEPEPEVSFGEFENEELLDPKLKAVLKGHLQAQLKQLKAAEAKLQAVEEREKQREEQSKRDAHNRAIDKMFAKHAHFVGDMSISEMHPEDPNLAKRQAVVGLAMQDKSKRSDQEKIDHAVSQLFGSYEQGSIRVENPNTASPRPGQRPTPAEWENGGVARPTQRKPAPELNGVKRAIKAVEDQLSKVQEPGTNGTVDYDDFPEK